MTKVLESEVVIARKKPNKKAQMKKMTARRLTVYGLVVRIIIFILVKCVIVIMILNTIK